MNIEDSRAVTSKISKKKDKIKKIKKNKLCRVYKIGLKLMSKKKNKNLLKS